MIPLLPIAIGIGVAITAAALTAYISNLRTISISQGYEKASKEFNKKFQKQYDDFMSHKKTWKKNKQEYEDLVNAYKKYAEELKKENEDLKRNGTASASAGALIDLGTTVAAYGAGLSKEIQYYETCLANLQKLKEKS
ncbi:hypothetical protein [Butyrivibrio sp. FC2001]|uniref:hypothetical protein n=1 Tax=Butyrivibrio sp. FC2001 TaxID=1280671 RepID=UPI0003FCF970|nr:hypothetical protein [Butyrivibrio sp. FC2001]